MHCISLIVVFSLGISSLSAITLLQDTTSVMELNWIAGCWKSLNSKFETREHWMPASGNMMIGLSCTVSDSVMIEYEFFGIEEIEFRDRN